MIKIGGAATIAAVVMVFGFLLYEALPLFGDTDAVRRDQTTLDAAVGGWLGVDEHNVIAWAPRADGSVAVHRLDNGTALRADAVPGLARVTTLTFSVDRRRLVAGYDDGTARLGVVDVSTYTQAEDAEPAADVVIRETPAGKMAHRARVEWDSPVTLEAGASILLADASDRGDKVTLAAITDTGALHVKVARRRLNLMTGETRLSLSGGSAPTPEVEARGAPAYLLLSPTGDTVYLAWSDGELLRLDARDPKKLAVLERVDLTPTPGVKLSALSWLIGRRTLLAGDTSGDVRAWFTTLDRDAATPDGRRLVNGHTLPGHGAAVTATAPSHRTRMVAVGYADGVARVFHVTGERELLELNASPGVPITALAVAPKEDMLYALSDGQMRRWEIHAEHPDAGMSAFFRPVWYEGATGPAHVWQSSGGDDAFEPKLGLMPLIFGTVKASLYSLLFGVPLALLAAVYTSEFMPRGVRARVKPVIEMMASLPSVVLGFLAALVIAPLIKDVIPGVLTALVLTPLAILLGAYACQAAPSRFVRASQRWRMLVVVVILAVGAATGMAAGGFVERLFFAGDMHAWLDGRSGNGVGGWMLLLLPLSGLVVGVTTVVWINPWTRERFHGLSDTRVRALHLTKIVGGVLAAGALAFALSSALSAVGADPRGGGGYLGTYVQRNALIVGLVMGYAIVPIIYTLAEEAMASVPDHLRAASLGAGATPWQTAIRIVVPTALSGLFSAVMVGLGRAVGETMIVLMAGGNTPVMEWSLFNGIRTLSANIAVELPEAPKGSTHYRTLVMAALVLFMLTFVINTAAELVRRSYRRKAVQL